MVPRETPLIEAPGSVDALKAQIWQLTHDLKLIEQAKAYCLPRSCRPPYHQDPFASSDPHNAAYWQRVLDYITIRIPTGKRRKRKSGVKLTPEQYARYQQAHEAWYRLEYPLGYNAGHYQGMEPSAPDVGASGGLTSFIVNYLDWTGNYGNRINTMGRKIGDKWIKGATKKGTGDISGIVNGRHVTWEVKIGSDRPSDKQLLQQSKIKRAGGEYFFVATVGEFFCQFDGLLQGCRRH
jgi:hypothetical protein